MIDQLCAMLFQTSFLRKRFGFAWRRVLGLCVLCFAVSLVARAQYVYRNYSTNDGLPSSTVYQCLQDSAGFIWFATDKGLCRFDGSDFVEIDADGYEGKSLTTISLAISNNHIIAGTFGGFMMIDGRARTVKIGVGPSEIDFESHRIAYAKDFLYYRTLDDHIAAYDLKRRRQYHIAKQDMRRPFCMATMHDGSLYYGQTGLYTIKDLVTHKVAEYLLGNKEIGSLSVDAGNRLWISAGNTIYCMKDQRITDSVKCPFYAGSPLFVHHSPIFGLVIYDHYGHGNKAYEELSCLLNQGHVCIITNLFEDRDGNLWVNTYNKGTFCILNSFISTFSGRSEVYDASIHDVYASRSRETYMATSLGMIYKKAGNFQRMDNAKEHFYYEVVMAGNHLLAAVATAKTDRLQKLSDKASGKAFYQLAARRLCLMNDSEVVYNAWNEHLFVAGIDFEKISLTRKKIIRLDTVVGRCTKIFKKDRSHVIVATTDACYLVDVVEGTSTRMEEIAAKVNDIIADASGTLYMASEAGLYILKHNRTYLVKDIKGMPLKNLSSLAMDKTGRLWIGYNKGLLAWRGDFLKRISGSPFMRSNEINRLFYEPVTNQLYIATNSALSVIDITRMDNVVARKPDIILLKVQSGDSIYPPAEPVKLMSGNDDADIYFSVIEISNPQDLYFRYTLNKGRSWTTINTKKISLRGLAYGDHQVIIQASANGVDWGREAEVMLHVDTPFYMTLRFWCWVLPLVVLIIVFGVKMRIRRIREKALKDLEMQHKLEELRYEALNAAVNPHFIFNTLGAIQSFVMNKDPFQASDYIAKFARLIRITLNHAGDKSITIHEEVTRLNLYLELEKLRCGDKMEYLVQVDPGVDKFCMIPNMIIQPLLENAILHGILPLRMGITGKLEVLVMQDEHYLIIQVRDNGIGITRHEESKHGYLSIGIDNLRERLSLVKGSDFIIKNLRESSSGYRGTVVEIRLPV